MESRDLIYKNGHFYDKKLRTRVEIVDGANVNISANLDAFKPVTSVGSLPTEILDSKEKENRIQSEPNISKFKKIFKKGDFLYFSIHRSIKNGFIIHEFKVELLEDLYLFLKKDWKLQDERLYDCACVVRESTANTIDFFEEVNAASLNEIYKYTFVHYFGNDGNPACNAIDRFYDQRGNEDSTIRRFRNK